MFPPITRKHVAELLAFNYAEEISEEMLYLADAKEKKGSGSKDFRYFIMKSEGDDKTFWGEKLQRWNWSPHAATAYKSVKLADEMFSKLKKRFPFKMKIVKGWDDGTAWNFEV
jgi:hypothetical protein